MIIKKEQLLGQDVVPKGYQRVMYINQWLLIPTWVVCITMDNTHRLYLHSRVPIYLGGWISPPISRIKPYIHINHHTLRTENSLRIVMGDNRKCKKPQQSTLKKQKVASIP